MRVSSSGMVLYFAVSILLLTFLLLLSVVPSHSAVEVNPETPTVSAQNKSLLVEAAYSDDSNNDSSITIQWGTQGTDWLDPSITEINLDNSASPYRFKIQNLNNYSSYQVKVIFHDLDGVGNGLDEQVIENIVPYNKLLHTSYTTGSLKWSAQGGWGVPNSKYGEFECQTCHGRKTGNIKRVKQKIIVTDNDSIDEFPTQVADATVNFQKTKSGESDFGDDTRAPLTGSTNICESCHSINKYHNFDSGQNENSEHYNKQDCIGCHEHNAGFMAGCGGCHPEVPTMASHDEHFNSVMLDYAFECATCHETADHKNSLSEVTFKQVDVIVNSATYVDADETSCYDEASGYCPDPEYMTCENLYCHSNSAPLAGTNSYANPVWGEAAMSCSSCHDPNGGAQAMSSPHGRHTDPGAYAYSCDKCHNATATGSSTIADTSLHINKLKDVDLAVSGTYDTGTNECSNIYCHSDGRSGASTSPSCLAVLNGCHYVDLDGDPDNGKEVNLGDQVTSVPLVPDWKDTGGYGCDACHKGRSGLEPKNAQMDSNAHFRLANEHWIRQYSCSFCHYKTVDENGVLKFSDMTHVNEQVDVAFDPKWKIVGYPLPSYNATTMVCDNIYCHSDGTTVSPQVRDFPWDSPDHANCDSCHGHDEGDDCSACHGEDVPQWSVIDQWKQAMPMYENTGPGTERANSHLRHLETEFSCENCHVYTVVGACHECHVTEDLVGKMTEVGHVDASYHVNGVKDVVFGRREIDEATGEHVVIIEPGSYDPVTKTCSNTKCHTGDDPQWGDSRRDNIICLTCHGTTGPDVTDYDAFNGVRGQINELQWVTSGHGRPESEGPYSKSGNPAADFPGNPCWYCHDSEVVHRDPENPLRLKYHDQFEQRFEKECVFCHMVGTDTECRACHDAGESLSPQLVEITNLDGFTVDHALMTDPDPADTEIEPVDDRSCMTSNCHMPQDETQCRSCHDPGSGVDAPELDDDTVRYGMENKPYKISEIQVGMSTTPYAAEHVEFSTGGTYESVSCMATPADWPPAGCHSPDAHIHNTNAGFWTGSDKDTIKNQYMMMGICLQCHDDDGNGQCNQCHTGSQYQIGYNPDPSDEDLRLIKGESQVTGFHYGWKHKEAKENYNSATHWPGGMFCWDCHDPHGDTNIYMIQDEVTTVNDGVFGIPYNTAVVDFTSNTSGLDYAKTSAPYNGICNVCHMNASQHYGADHGDNHQTARRCTECHEHSFSDSHASGDTCNGCHDNRPIPRHTAFTQPRDCTKCHEGAVNKRMNIMRQFRAQSHHVQGVEVTNKHCYACHWEATDIGLINPDYHEGYNYRSRLTVKDAKNDLVIWGPGVRPEEYVLDTTAVTFTATNIGTASERAEVTKISGHCLGCHSDQNNFVDVFEDCKTPSQYAWDRTSIAARYLQTGTTTWGKYYTKNTAKAYSAHGKAYLNKGGWSTTNGEDSSIPNTRNGSSLLSVQCYDCHSSHGSYTAGDTSSYISFGGGYNGANLKETKPGKGGYTSVYMAADTSEETGILNPMSPGANQCLDCHETRHANNGTPDDSSDDLPWGFQSTFGASEPIIGYRDTARLGGGVKGNQIRYPWKSTRTGKGGHFKVSKAMTTTVNDQIRGSCAACHDPHGVSPSLGSNMQYAVPLLKGTWITSPYKEDIPQEVWENGKESGPQTWRTYDPPSKKIYITPDVTHSDEQFAGLCLRCHPKDELVSSNPGWLSMQRNHRSVAGWGTNTKHSFSCSKCHNAHDSGLGRLMRTNCFNYKHRGGVDDNSGFAGTEQSSYVSGYRFPNTKSADNCHASVSPYGWPNNQKWNNVTPW